MRQVKGDTEVLDVSVQMRFVSRVHCSSHQLPPTSFLSPTQHPWFLGTNEGSKMFIGLWGSFIMDSIPILKACFIHTHKDFSSKDTPHKLIHLREALQCRWKVKCCLFAELLWRDNQYLPANFLTTLQDSCSNTWAEMSKGAKEGKILLNPLPSPEQGQYNY